MPKWKKDETVFKVSVNDDGNGGYICRIPKPIVERLKINNCVSFLVKNRNTVVVEADTK